MKNWKYIDGAKVGNIKAISSTFHINDYGVEVGQWSWDWQGKAPDENKQKEIERKIKSYVQQINKNVPAGDSDERDAVFSQLDKFVRAQGLNKMAKYTSKADSKKEFLYDEETGDLEVWYDGKKVDSLKKAGEGWKKYIETHATKTGNAESFDEFVKKLAKEKPELYQSLWNAGQMEALKSYYHKITGNDTPAEYFSKKPKVIGNEKTGAEGFFKKLSNDVKEREDKDDADIEKVGNSKWELPDGSTATVEDDGTIKIKKPRDSSIYITKLWDKERAEKQLAQKGAKKVGNAKDKNDKDLKIGDIVDVRGKKGKITKIIGDVIEVFYDNSGTYNPDRIDRHYADEATKVGNFKTGKSALKPGDRVQSYGVQGTVRKVEGENSDNIYGEPIIEVEWDNGTVKKVGEHYLRKIGNKVGNSAPDEKFAYVMREFDEGKLKTPDGKVVTDPAQAKAIAYSESKKTENGLARARNAIKKS